MTESSVVGTQETTYGTIDWLQSPTITKLTVALLKARGEFDPVLKDATNPAFKSKYSSLSSVYAGVDGALLANGILHTCQTGIGEDGRNFAVTRVIHAASGEWLGSRWKLTPTQATPQGEGSALTYARRYGILSLLGIAAEDDDANAASTTQRQPYVRTAPAAVPDAPAIEPSGRDWGAEATTISKQRVVAVTRRERLLQLMEECRGFNELDQPLYARFVELGNTLKAEIEAAAKVA